MPARVPRPGAGLAHPSPVATPARLRAAAAHPRPEATRPATTRQRATLPQRQGMGWREGWPRRAEALEVTRSR